MSENVHEACTAVDPDQPRQRVAAHMTDHRGNAEQTPRRSPGNARENTAAMLLLVTIT